MATFTSLTAAIAFLKTRQGALAEADRVGMRSAGNLLVETAKDLIGTEDASWPPLAPSTVEEKRRLGYTGRVSETDPLLRTGSLRASIVAQSEAAGLGRGTVLIGSPDPVAAYQEFGTDRGIPPRPFIGAALFREGEAAAHRVLNYELGALVGSAEPLVPIKRLPNEPAG